MVAKIADLADGFVHGTKGDKIKIGRTAVRLSQTERQQLKKAIEDAGGRPSKGMLDLIAANGNSHLPDVLEPTPPPEPSQEPTRRVLWGEDDWDFVVSRVAKLLMKEPTSGISALARRIMKMMPEDNRRSVHAGLVSELARRLVEYNAHWLDLEAEVEKLRNELLIRKVAPSKEEILQGLTNEEIRERFTNEVLASLSPDEIVSRLSTETILSCIPTAILTAHSLTRIFENFMQQSRQLDENEVMLGRILAEVPAEKVHRQQVAATQPQPVKLPRIALVGFKNEQGAFIVDGLRGRAKVEIIDKNRSHFESSADIILMWARFVSHSMQDQIKKNMKVGARLITHNYDDRPSGLKAAVTELGKALAR
jgi:hypothetical protein